jgi:phospholipase C
LPDLSDSVGTVVIVMMENRSFDHMLGYLSLIDPKINVDGFEVGDAQPQDYRIPETQLMNDDYLNISSVDGAFHYPFHRLDNPLAIDLPHNRHSVWEQLGKLRADGSFTMDGFVDAYYDNSQSRMDLADPMAFFTSGEVPTHDFFARNFAVCDRWFSPIPADTQPNRLIALSGFTSTDRTATLLPDQKLIFDWLDENHISWRVYSDDISFFALFPKLWLPVLTDHDHFRDFSELALDVSKADTTPFPKVVIIEPSYRDSPIHPHHNPNDNHPPLPVGFGEDFLRQVYQALTPPASLSVWQKLVMIVHYDEHGGFYDHVSPLAVNTTCGTGNEPFTSTGIRVPGLLISPFVKPGQVYPGNLDHTSVLEFLAEWLTPGTPYSSIVDQRLAQPGFNAGRGRGHIAEALDFTAPRLQPPDEPTGTIKALSIMSGKRVAEHTNELAFEDALSKMVDAHPNEVAQRYPELIHWKLNR